MTALVGPASCPACGAAVRPDAPWCSLCYADLRPPTSELRPPPEPAGAAPPPSPVGPVWKCLTCGAANDMERSACSDCGADFLAAARSSEPLLTLPLLGDITRFGRGQRFALAAAVALAFVLVVVGVSLVGW